MALAQSNEQHIDRLVDGLTREYEGIAEGDQVNRVVRAEYKRLSEESAVTDFATILTERRARAWLRRRWGGRKVAGAPPEQMRVAAAR
jgi:hypothetical protein